MPVAMIQALAGTIPTFAPSVVADHMPPILPYPSSRQTALTRESTSIPWKLTFFSPDGRGEAAADVTGSDMSMVINRMAESDRCFIV